VVPGINYHRRRSREIGGGVRWLADGKPRPMTLKEKQSYGIAEAELAAICSGMRADDFDRYWNMGVRFPEIESIAGAVGIGTAGPGEAKNGRPPIWTAIKRAETDLLRQLYPNMERLDAKEAEAALKDTLRQVPHATEEWHDVTFSLGEDETPEAYDLEGGTVDGETGEIIEPPPAPEPAPSGNGASLAEIKREWFDRVMREVPYYGHTKHVVNTLKQLGYTTFEGNDPDEMLAKLQEHASAKADQDAAG
jgi:hypothetical protein